MPAYPGPGQARLIRVNNTEFLLNDEPVSAGLASVALQLDKLSYPFGFAVEVGFSAAPGAFSLQVQGAERDLDSSYTQLGAITAVNAGNTARFDGGSSYPKFVRVLLASGGAGNITALLSR